MNGPTRRLALVVFIGFALLLGSVTWFQVLAVDRYRDDPRNNRTLISETGKERGVIVTLDGTVLARSSPDPGQPQSYIRSYPAGPAFSPVVGYTSRLVGSTGLEAAYADELRSRRDFTISDLISALLGGDLRPRSIQTTVDPELTRLAYQALDGQRGAVVALDPKTGEVLAYVSSPSYDPETLLGADAVDARQQLLDDPAQPLLDRAGQNLYAPGSTFKVIVAATALEIGSAGLETQFPDVRQFQLPGSTATISNFGGGLCVDGTSVSLEVAFVRSCNTVFADLAIRLGAVEIEATARPLGFNQDIRFPWNLARSSFPVEELTGDLAALGQSGIGERDVRATPLVMAMVAAAVANEGQVMEPHLLRQIFDADGQTVDGVQPRPLGRAMSPATAALLSEMMERVVTEGTGRRATVPGVRVAGKTGTAQGSGGPPDAWFIGFAPVEDPSIALAVVVEDGGDAGESATGGSVAAPIAAQLIDAWLTR